MKIILLLLFFLTFSSILFSQQNEIDDNRVVARAGSENITAEEFKDRFDFSPHPIKNPKDDTLQIKREFLYTLIAEKLLAQKAKMMSLDTAKEIEDILSYMERLFVRDAYYRNKISDKVKVTSGDMENAEKRYSKLLIVKYVYSEDEKEIKQLYEELKNGYPIDTLIKKRPEYEEQKTPGTVTFGTLEKNLEDSIYNLKPGQFTEPLKAVKRWYIFKLIRTIDNPVFDTDNMKVKLKKIIEDRKTNKLENDFLYNFLHRQKVEVDKNSFFEIARLIDTKIKERKKLDNNSLIILDSYDFDDIINSLDQIALNKPFIKFEKNPETVKEFLTQMKFNSFKIDTLDIDKLIMVLNKYVKDYIEYELLVRAAYNEGIENLFVVKNDRKIWEDYYLSQKLEKIIYDSISISDAEAYEYYTKNNNILNNPNEVNVKEIFVDSLNKIEVALKEINNGMSFEKISKKYSIIDSLRERGGDLGYFPVITHGEIGKAADKMNVGDLYGPIKTNDGYALIKLVDKRKSNKPIDTSFVNIKDNLIEILKGIELRKRLKKRVAGLAAEYGLKINTDIFNSIDVTQFNTFTIRMIGFGGRIYAFPYQQIFGDWYDVYKSKVESAPQ